MKDQVQFPSERKERVVGKKNNSCRTELEKINLKEKFLKIILEGGKSEVENLKSLIKKKQRKIFI